MVPEFDAAAWSLGLGQTSDLVKSQYGFHIIRVTDKRAATTRTLDQVKGQIDDQIRTEKAQAEAARLSEEIARQITSPADLDRVAKERGFTVGDSGLFGRDEPLAGLGYAPMVAAQAFQLEQGKTSGAIQTNQGFAFIAVTEVKASELPTLDQVRDKVTGAVVTAKAIEVARARAAALASSGNANFTAAAKTAGVTVQSTDFVARGAALPEIGVSTSVDNAVFALKPGQTTEPIATETAVVVARVRERQDMDGVAFVAERDLLRQELANARRQAFFNAYMEKAMARMNITYDEATINQVIGQ
jgi:peptidyl-prolyl cis-trans isomerase D